MISWDVFYKDMVWPHKLSFPIFGFVSRILISKTKISACFAKYMFLNVRDALEPTLHIKLSCLASNNVTNIPIIHGSVTVRISVSFSQGFFRARQSKNYIHWGPEKFFLPTALSDMLFLVDVHGLCKPTTVPQSCTCLVTSSQLCVITVAQSCTCLVASSAL